MEALAAPEMHEEYFNRALHRDFREVLQAHFHDDLQQFRADHDMILAVLPEILSTPELRQRFLRDFIQPITMMFERQLRQRPEMAEAEPVQIARAIRALVAMVFGFQMLLMFDEPVTRDLWEKPDELVDLWIKSIFEGCFSSLNR